MSSSTLSRYVTIGEAIKNSRDNEQRGYRYSYDMLGEAATTACTAVAGVGDMSPCGARNRVQATGGGAPF